MSNLGKKNIEQAIHHFLQGNASSEEEKILYNWMKKSSENRLHLFREKDLWEASKSGSEELKEIQLEQWIELQERIASGKIKMKGLREFIRIAAVIVIALGVGWMGHYFYSSEIFSTRNSELKTVEVSKGQLKEIFLADGTHVWLNSDSELSFPSQFDADNRKVELSGEAYFEVTANEEKPFFVRTKNHTVKVVGTRFNICEYPENHIIKTTLVEGKVKIITGNIIHDLLPGQQASFNTETAKIRINKTDFEIYTAWKDGRYEFRNESVGKVFQIMERWWDVKIDFPVAKLKNERISGVLRRHKSLEQHFELIKQLIPIEYKIDNDDVINVIVK